MVMLLFDHAALLTPFSTASTAGWMPGFLYAITNSVFRSLAHFRLQRKPMEPRAPRRQAKKLFVLRPKTRQWRSVIRQFEGNFFLSVNNLTLPDRFLTDAA
jgi:hypothetical protein